MTTITLANGSRILVPDEPPKDPIRGSRPFGSICGACAGDLEAHGPLHGTIGDTPLCRACWYLAVTGEDLP